jgi:outer membrane lipoprotein-sorting protein
MKTRMLAAVFAALVTFACSAKAIEPGKFSFKAEAGRFSIEANQAPVNEVLTEISGVTQIPVTFDMSDASTTSANASGTSLERIINQVSQGYAIIYAEDPETKEYRIERIVAAGQGKDAAASLKPGELKASDVVEAITKRASEVKRYHQNVTMSTQMMGTEFKTDGEAWMDGDRFRMESKMPPNQTQIIVSDGKTTYTYMPMMKMLQKMDMARVKAALGDKYKNQFNDPSNSNPLKGMDAKSLKYYGTETLNDESVYVIEGKLGGEMEKMKSVMPTVPETAKFWISTKDGLPRKLVFHTGTGTEMMSQEFSNVEVNPKLDPALFEFTPPEGVQVTDMTDGVINMLATMNAATNAATTQP